MKEPILAYDICSLPDFNDFNIVNLVDLWRDHNLVLWDSAKGSAPTITPKTDKFIIIDMAKQREDAQEETKEEGPQAPS